MNICEVQKLFSSFTELWNSLRPSSLIIYLFVDYVSDFVCYQSQTFGHVQVGMIPLNSAMTWDVLDATVRRIFKVFMPYSLFSFMHHITLACSVLCFAMRNV